MRQHLRAIVTAALFALVATGCESPSAEGESGGGEEEASAEGPDDEMAPTNLPGVETMPASVKEKLERALEQKKQSEDPTFETHHTTDDGLPKYTNRLILSSNPYLQQHAHNPTNWFPWGEEAFEKAEREQKPILLSVGYTTCHWCHVMAKKSFDDEEIAEYLNEHYVVIKVDREERPDIDDRYMSAVRMISGGGGWPMTVWLTPQKLPFMGGTYFPPNRFLSLLKKMNQKYQNNRNQLQQQAQKIASRVHRSMEGAGGSGTFPDAASAMNGAFRMMQRGFDETNGGWGQGNKFPMPSRLQFLLNYHKRTGKHRALEMVEKTLDGMMSGGIYDHVGGGFHRYSTDPEWLVPHFEKMLYTNAQLVLTYTKAWQATKNPEYARVVEETLDYLMRDMTNEAGALYAATHADSRPEEGGELEEGVFFVWTPDEIERHLSERQANLVKTYYDVTDAGNFEGSNILHTPKSREVVAEELGIGRETFDKRLERARKSLYHARGQRPSPPLDDNILTAWNGLALEAFARAALVFDDDRWLAQSKKIASFILEKMRRDDGTLLRSRTEGKPGPRAYSADYAFAIAGLLNLYEASGEPRWLKAAAELQRQQIEDYWDDENGGFFQTANESDVPLARQKPDRDGSTPSSNSYAALNLLKLYQFTLDEEFEKRGREVLEAFGSTLERRGPRLSRMLVALDFVDAEPREIAFVAPKAGAPNPMMNVYRKTFLPNAVLVRTDESAVSSLKETVPWMDKKKSKNGATTAYVCRDFTCKYPATDPTTFEEQISEVTPLK